MWWAFALLAALVAADNLLWRVAGYYRRSHLRRRHRRHPRATCSRYLSGHSPGYFAERLPGALASRISATANATFTLENTGSWNVLPPVVAVCLAIALIGSVNPTLAAGADRRSPPLWAH